MWNIQFFIYLGMISLINHDSLVKKYTISRWKSPQADHLRTDEALAEIILRILDKLSPSLAWRIMNTINPKGIRVLRCWIHGGQDIVDIQIRFLGIWQLSVWSLTAIFIAACGPIMTNRFQSNVVSNGYIDGDEWLVNNSYIILHTSGLMMVNNG